MVKLQFRHFDHDSVADGAKFEQKWTADKDYTVKAFLVKRKDGASLTKSDITVWIMDEPLTRDHVLCSTLGVDWFTAWRLEEPLNKNTDIRYEGYNREGATIDLVVELVLEIR